VSGTGVPAAADWTYVERPKGWAVYLSDSEGFDLLSAAKRQRRVVFALMLRNIRTRFGGHGLGYLLAIAWPIVHMLVFFATFILMGRTAPYGDSVILFIATGVVPFMSFSYLSRFMMMACIITRPLLGFPEVKVLDVLLASALLEALAACLVIILMIVIAWFVGIDFVPKDVVQAAFAFGAALLLGLGFGLVNGVLGLAVKVWPLFVGLQIIVLWIASGVAFVPDMLPQAARHALSYNPVLHVVEWMRSAYYEGYGDLILDRGYPIAFGMGAAFIGLLLERAMRGYLLAHR
jgi:capsular polysaccharide transport system permease protein